MLPSTKNMLRLLAVQGLTLTNYDWSDYENGLLKDLTFTYYTNKGLSGTIELGDIEIDLYMDCGDVCVDTMDNLYILEENGIDTNWNDFLEDNPNLKRTSVPDITFDFDKYKFYEELMDYYED